MAWMARVSAGVEGGWVELQQQQQQQHGPGVKTLGDDGKPPKSELALTGIAHAEQRQAPSMPLVNAELFPML